MYHILKSRSTRTRTSDVQKRILTVPKSNPNIYLETATNDPSSQDFTAFNVFDTATGNLLGMFRAEDIVHQRNFMAALGGKGPGLFTQNSDDTLEITVLVDGPPNNELFKRQNSYDSRRSNRTRSRMRCPSYIATMAHLPREFYLPEGVTSPTVKLEFPGEPLTIYNSVDSLPPNGMCSRRPENDTFLPPHGNPVNSPVSLGYGKEVGLEPLQQAIWVPENDFYYFLDHEKKTSFLEDPRPLNSPKTVVTKKQVIYSGSTESPEPNPDVCRDIEVIKATASRAISKPHGFVFQACGTNGLAGVSGTDGVGGANGEHGQVGISFEHAIGADGGSGTSGFPGTEGQTGSGGTTGVNGSDLTLSLSGNSTKLEVSDCNMCITAKLGGDCCEDVLLVDCHGGDGGDGGVGGEGGCGGDGGDGGDGGRDGDGGHGGDGGMGGNGGNGGTGGDAGSGGTCVIQSVDPCLLMLIESNCEAGKAGKGGTRGKGGEGGRRGFGGEAGTSQDPTGSPQLPRSATVVGLRGKPGMPGFYGEDGKPGDDGKEANHGGILWVIKSSNGDILHQAESRYTAEITTLTITPGVNDGIYEPNQRISIKDITVLNSGGLPLPAGSKLFFPSSETVRFEDTVYTLPEISPKKSFVVPTTFNGRIFDLAPANEPGPFSTQAVFAPRIELLGRPFEKSSIEQTLPVMYPVKLPFALSRGNVSRAEVTTLDVGIENVSSVIYGSCPDSAGSLRVRVHMDARLIPVGIVSGQQSNGTLPYIVTYDPTERDSLYIEVKKINPGEMLVVSVLVQMDPLAELCDTCVWQAVLYFKGKRIEYRSKEIRISPAYTPPSKPSQLGDILMITSDNISREQFQYWQKIFEILNVSVDFWDSNYRKESTGEQSPQIGTAATSAIAESPKPKLYQMYSGKVILYPHCDLDSFPAKEITRHFHGTPQNGTDILEDKNSSMLLFLKSTFPENLEDYTNQHSCNTRLLKHLCSSQEKIKLPVDAYSGHHLLAPGTLISPEWSMKRSRQSTMKKVEGETPSQSVALVKCTNRIRQTSRIRYSYGSMDVRRVPLLRSCNFQCIDCTGTNFMAMGSDDPLLTPSSREFPLGSNFGQVLLSVLNSLPLRCKLTILKKPVDKSSPHYVKFHLPNGLKLKKRDLAAICIASDVTNELLNCSKRPTRMTAVCEDIETNKAVFVSNGPQIVVQMMELIKQEVKERSRVTNVISVSKEILGLCDSMISLMSNRVANTSFQGLPPLRTLQDRNSVLRSHQYNVDDDYYDASTL